MHSFSRSILSAAVAALLAAPTVTLAQSADATLRGRAPVNADITAKNVATGATRRTKAGADGSYTLAGLQPGTYRVDAGPGTETTVTVTVASTATLNLAAQEAVAQVEAPIEEITVEGRRLTEVRTSEVGTTVSLQQIQTVPQATRNFLEFADIVPGVAFQVDPNGRTSIRGGAQNANGVNVYIDGVGQKGYVRSGVSGQAGDTQGSPFPQLAIDEYKVITSNYKAEYDQISSAAITAVTRSGTNTFEGQAFGTFTQDSWRARYPGERVSGVKTPSESREYGFAFGGPILQDRLHFFLTYEAKRFETPKTVVPGGNAPANIVAQLPPDAVAQLGAATVGFDEDLVFGKLSWTASDSDRFDLSVKIRDEVGQGSQAGLGVAQSAAVDTDNDDKRYELSWQHTGGNWVNDLQLTYEDAFFVPRPVNPDTSGVVYSWFNGVDQNILALDGSDPRAGQNKGQKGWAIADSITWSDLGWIAGNHTIKAGIKYKEIELTAADAVPGLPVYYYDVSPTGVAPTPWKAAVALPVSGFPTTATSDAQQLGVYVQDDWEVNDKLTLNLGVRWDIEENPSYHDYVTPQFVVDAFNTEISPGLTYAQSLALSSDPNVRVDVNDYISTGNNRKPYKNAFQPRLGFSYDFGADQQHVLFGGAGRAYDRTLYDYLQLEQTKFALGTAEVRFNTTDHPCPVNGTNCVNWDPAYAADPAALVALFAGRPGEINLINNDLRVPYSDQISLGMRNRIGDWNTSAAVSRIESNDGFVFTLGNRHPDGAFFNNVRAQPWSNAPPTLGSLIIGNSGIKTKSTQLLLSAEKPFDEASRWGTTMAYTYTRARQNRDINEHYLFDAPSINAFPYIESNAAPKHRFVATGTYSGPWGLILSGKVTLSTPTPRNVIACLPPPQTFPGGGACNPWSYELPTSDGYRSLDLQVTKNLEIGDLGSMYVRLDLINATNEENLADYTDEVFDGSRVTGRLNPDGNLSSLSRTLRASFGVKF
jgi:outer membrane receptor protein involved in Fe transport